MVPILSNRTCYWPYLLFIGKSAKPSSTQNSIISPFSGNQEKWASCCLHEAGFSHWHHCFSSGPEPGKSTPMGAVPARGTFADTPCCTSRQHREQKCFKGLQPPQREDADPVSTSWTDVCSAMARVHVNTSRWWSDRRAGRAGCVWLCRGSLCVLKRTVFGMLTSWRTVVFDETHRLPRRGAWSVTTGWAPSAEPQPCEPVAREEIVTLQLKWNESWRSKDPVWVWYNVHYVLEELF